MKKDTAEKFDKLKKDLEDCRDECSECHRDREQNHERASRYMQRLLEAEDRIRDLEARITR